jgi:glycosyltransferase involved in cell wall biosynthesis
MSPTPTETPTLTVPEADAESAATPSSAEEPVGKATGKRGLVLMPAFNEEGGLAGVLDQIRACCEFDILVIDDGSTDRTAKIAREHGAKVLRHPFNMGYGAALQTGYKYAAQGDYDVLVQIDADGQHDPSYITPLADRVLDGHSDACVGSRFLEGEGYIPPFARRVGMVLFGYIASVVTQRRVTDPTSGYQALSRRVFSFFQSDLFPADYPDADVLILLYRAGFRAEEIPVAMKPSATGKSMHSGLLRPLFYVFKMFLSIGVTMLREPPNPDQIPR